MLNKDHFYHNMIRRYIVAFHHIFSDIHVQRYDASGNLKKDIKVGVTYGSKSKLFYLLQNKDQDHHRKINTILPRITFLFETITPDIERYASRLNTTTLANNPEDCEYIYNPIPYTFGIPLRIFAKKTEDLLQIVEQILSFFMPDYGITVKEPFGIERDIPVILGDISMEQENDFDIGDRPLREALINFSLPGWIYPTIKTHKTIRSIDIDLMNEERAIFESIDIDQDPFSGEITDKIIN